MKKRILLLLSEFIVVFATILVLTESTAILLYKYDVISTIEFKCLFVCGIFHAMLLADFISEMAEDSL